MTKAITTADIVKTLQEFADLKQEHFICFSLDLNHQLIKQRTVFMGTLTTVIAHPREVFAYALEDRAATIIIAHNHPSGVAEPSDGDIEITNQFISAGLLMGIPVEDHLIIGSDRYYSFAEAGVIDPFATIQSIKKTGGYRERPRRRTPHN